MYIDQVSSDAYDEEYSFFYNKFNKVDKIQDGQKKNILAELPNSARIAFIEFGENLIRNSGTTSGNKNSNGHRKSR